MLGGKPGGSPNSYAGSPSVDREPEEEDLEILALIALRV